MAAPYQPRPAGSVVLFLTSEAFWALVIAWQNLDRSFTVPLVKVGNCAALGSLPPCISFNGLELMLDFGAACTKPDVFDDPSSLFALFKYASTVATAADFRLNSVVRDTDYHKKTLMSDEFGCGGAFVAARRLFSAQWFVDFSTAVRYGWVQTLAPRSRRPDYLCQSIPGTSDLILLEAKGTQSSRDYCEKTQIPSGCEQLQTVRLVDSAKQITQRAAIGFALSHTDEPDETAFYVGDPGEGRKTYEYKIDGAFEEVALKNHYLRLSAFHGDGELSSRLKGFTEQPGRVQTIRRFADRDVIGTSCVAVSPAGTLELFLGIDAAVREFLLGDRVALDVAKAGFEAHRTFNSIERGLASTPDGALLSVSLSL